MSSCRNWEQIFGPNTSLLEKTVQRAWLARILRFYARKGHRHGLNDGAYHQLLKEIDMMVAGKDRDLPSLQMLDKRAYVFCPQYQGEQPCKLETPEGMSAWVFGAADWPPDLRVEASSRSSSVSVIPPVMAVNSPTPQAETTGVLLGTRTLGTQEVRWETSIKGNPHLMILGLPGMGKTTSLINICQQLQAQAVTPIVFSYHEDIDEKLAACLPEPPLMVQVQRQGLGFNPMAVNNDTPYGHVDNIGMLRDIFSAIFPDLGDVQLGRLRDALKQSYLDAGWGPNQRGEVPAFRTFFDLLKAEEKPDRGLLLRLGELDDYGFFDAVSGAPSLLEQTRPTLIQIHSTQNECLQRAFATFVLYNLYQAMFQRGAQERITHAVIFDEAHRASRLKLIPTMVKECRKYGIAFVVASQEAKDFDASLVNGVANYLALRLIDADAKLMAKRFVTTDKVQDCADKIKQLPKFQAMFYAEGLHRPHIVKLASPSGSVSDPSLNVGT